MNRRLASLLTVFALCILGCQNSPSAVEVAPSVDPGARNQQDDARGDESLADTEPGIVIGHVRAGGVPAERYLVQLVDGREKFDTSTDRSGNFTISDVPTGRYLLNVVDYLELRASGELRIKTRAIEVSSGELVDEEFEFDTGFTVSGSTINLPPSEFGYVVLILRPGAPSLTGEPLRDALPVIELTKYQEGTVLVKNGEAFQVRDIPTGQYILRISRQPAPDSPLGALWPDPLFEEEIVVGRQDLRVSVGD